MIIRVKKISPKPQIVVVIRQVKRIKMRGFGTPEASKLKKQGRRYGRTGEMCQGWGFS
jgi:hypothetical protein